MATARRLKNLSIREVSSVTRGAGENVKILLMKRADDKTTKTNKSDTLEDQIAKATAALAVTVEAIKADEDVDQEAAILKAVSDFNTHMADLLGPDAGDDAMSKEILDAIAKMSGDIAFAKMTDPHKVYATTMKLEGDALKKFVEADDAGREAIMKEFPPKKDEKKKPGAADDSADCAKIIKLDDLPQEVVAKLAQADQDRVVLKGLQEAAEVTKYENKAVELGLAKAYGATIRKAFSGDAKAQEEMEKLLKGMAAQIATGKVFEQLGNEGKQVGASAMDEIRAKAAELRKSDTKLSDAQAIDKVLTDPANAELAKRERDERMLKIGGGVRAA